MLLLDTHAFLWWLDGDPKRSPRAKAAIATVPAKVHVSGVSAWEISTKARIGKLPDAMDVAADVAGCIAREGFQPFAVTVQHGQRDGALPGPIKDPFDRMLVAMSWRGARVLERALGTVRLQPQLRWLVTLAVAASTLDAIATEIRHLARTEVREVQEPFAEAQKGSSAMPHKRNPVASERVSGLARVIRGHAVASMENVTLWHERDISHSSAERVIFPDACIVLDFMLDQATELIEGLVVYPDRMRANLELTGGLVYSQRVMLALVESGMDRQEAYRLVQRLALAAWDGGPSFRDALERSSVVNIFGISRGSYPCFVMYLKPSSSDWRSWSRL